MKSIIVARVSTDEQKENSPDAQLFRMRQYCTNRGFETIREWNFVESAYKTKRDEFDEVIEYIQDISKKEKFAVCFDKVDRLSRNIFDKRVALLYEMSLKGQIELHFVSDSQIINDKMNAGDQFAFNMKLGLSKYYSDAIGDNVRRAFEQKRRNGEWTGKVRVGYLTVQEDVEKRLRKDIIVDPERGHLVQKMFEIYSTGNYSLKKLQIEITNLGLTSINGNILQRSNIDNILKDSFYCGTAISAKYGPYVHNYPRLITRELFDKCQEVRKDRTVKKTKEISKEFLFKGLFKCHNCGCSMTPELQKGNVYYSCTNAKGVCKRVYSNEKDLLKPIYENVLDKFETISEHTVEGLLNELRKNVEAEKIFHHSQIKRIQAEYEKATVMDGRLLDALLTESITRDIYNKKHQELQDTLQRLTIELAEHQGADNNYQTTIASIISVSRRAKSIFEKSSDMAGKRAFLKMLLQNPTVNGKELYFTIASPFNLVLQLANCPSWLPDKDSNLD